MKRLVELGVVLHFLIGIGHLACMFRLDTVFRFYGIDGFMDKVAEFGSALPYLITICIAAAFFLAGFYGLSALGAIRRLPLQRAAFVTMVVLFLGRAAWGIGLLIHDFSWLELSSTCFALLLGICYVSCLRFSRQDAGAHKQ